jgi:hypothetical protein
MNPGTSGSLRDLSLVLKTIYDPFYPETRGASLSPLLHSRTTASKPPADPCTAGFLALVHGQWSFSQCTMVAKVRHTHIRRVCHVCPCVYSCPLSIPQRSLVFPAASSNFSPLSSPLLSSPLLSSPPLSPHPLSSPLVKPLQFSSVLGVCSSGHATVTSCILTGLNSDWQENMCFTCVAAIEDATVSIDSSVLRDSDDCALSFRDRSRGDVTSTGITRCHVRVPLTACARAS